jgi:citrate synthase
MAERGAVIIEDLVAEVLKVPRDRITDDLEYGGIAEWDSLAHVNLMLAIEERCGVDIDEDMMVELTSIAALRTFARESGGR